MTTFVEVIEREETFTIDGYSNAKTLLGVVNDVGKVVKKYESEEAFKVGSNSETEELLLAPQTDCDYFFTVEDVPHASTWDEEKDEMQYKDGYNFYFCIRVCKH